MAAPTINLFFFGDSYSEKTASRIVQSVIHCGTIPKENDKVPNAAASPDIIEISSDDESPDIIEIPIGTEIPNSTLRERRKRNKPAVRTPPRGKEEAAPLVRKFKKRRLEAGLTQREVALALGMTQDEISRYENMVSSLSKLMQLNARLRPFIRRARRKIAEGTPKAVFLEKYKKKHSNPPRLSSSPEPGCATPIVANEPPLILRRSIGRKHLSANKSKAFDCSSIAENDSPVPKTRVDSTSIPQYLSKFSWEGH